MFTTFVRDFAEAMVTADSLGLSAQGRNRQYRPGIGPHSEPQAIRLTIEQMKALHPNRYHSLTPEALYPGSNQKCDLVWSTPTNDWAIEVKMIRFRGDNGKLADLSVQDILSPYADDHSALSDCLKLTSSAFRAQLAIIVYGFEDQERPLDVIIDAFEVLASHYVHLGSRCEALMPNLIHPVHSSGRVFGWTLSSPSVSKHT